jgi:capsular exopolysaccharide synthesis family protein
LGSDVELRSYLPVLRAHWLGIVLLTLFGGLLAFGWSLLQPQVYSADASGYVTAGTNSDTGNALVGDNLAQSKVKSYIDIGQSRSVAQFAIDELDLTNVSPEQLVSQVEVTNPVDTVLLKVSANGPTPTDARDLAESWLRGIAAQIQVIENPGAVAGSSTGVVQLIPLDSAVLPESPTSPNVRLAIVIGLIAGLMLGLVYAAIRHTFDRRIQNAEAVERETGLSVIGSIPVDRRFTDDDRLVSMEGATDYSRTADDDAAVAEALREVRTNLQFMDVDNPPRVIVVTSPLPGDGKSTTIANLAIALAAGGQRVVLIDGDLRRPTVSRTFNLLEGAGLTDVLAGRSDLVDVMQPWGTSGRLMILAAGNTPPNPSELLGSERMHKLLAELSSQAIVLIDAPPLIPVTDAAILTHNTDGALIVGSVGKTTYDGLNRALQNLQKANGRALGIILNRVPRRSGAFGYGYGYGSTYRSRHTDFEGTSADNTAEIAAATPISANEVVPASRPFTRKGDVSELRTTEDPGSSDVGSAFDAILLGVEMNADDSYDSVNAAAEENAPRTPTRREIRNRTPRP